MTLLTQWVFKNKAALWILVLLTLVMGVNAYLTMPKEILPGVDIPQITVTVMATGYDADSVVKEVTEPLEQALTSVQGKTKLYSESNDGFASLNLLFDAKTDMRQAKADVSEALANVQLPQGVSKPYVMQMNLSMIPVSQVSLSFKDGWTQENLATLDKDILPLFQKVEGVSNVMAFGRPASHVSIKVDKEKLAAAQVPLQALAGLLQGKDASVALGDLTLNGQTTTLKVVGKIDDVQTLQELALTPAAKLKDVAKVEVIADTQSVSRVDGQPATVLTVQKNLDANAVQVGKGVQDAVAALQNQFGDQIKLDVMYATSDNVVASVDSMMEEVLMGALFAAIVIMVFLRNVRMTLITIVSIPLSLAITLFLLQRSGITLNMLTLGAVAVSVGRLVDDSIVVIENIYRRFSAGAEDRRAVILDATKEVAAAITSSTFTTVAVFLPIGLVTGTLSKMMLPFALTMTYSLLASLLVALTVIPVMSAGLLKNVKMQEHKPAQRFTRFLEWNLNHKWLPLLVAVVALAGSVGAYVTLPQSTVDSGELPIASVNLSFKNGTPLDTVKVKAHELESFLLQQPEVKHAWLILGNSDDAARFGQVRALTKVELGAILKDGADSKRFVQAVKDQQAKFADATLTVATQSMSGGGGSTVTLDLRGAKIDQLIAASKQVIDEVKGIEGVEKVETNQSDPKPTYEIVMNQNAPLSAQELAMQLRMVTAELPIGKIKLDGKDTVVLLDSGLKPGSLDEINKMNIMTTTGIVPLSAVAKLEKSEKPSSVLRMDGHEYLRVTATVDPKNLSKIGQDIALATRDLDLPDGVELKIGGATEDLMGDMTSLYQTMLASIGVVYLILVITFKTLRTPLAILFTLPLAAIGAVLGLILSRVSVDPTVAIGALMLIGIVVTNAIVLLDRVKQNEHTMSIRDAVLEATAVRMRPILMTAVATICAMLPQLFGKAEAGALVGKGLGVVVIGGLSVATLLTLVIVPVIYEGLHFRKAKKQRQKQPNPSVATH